jgi:imidazole glycerol-phosphate synthase subunit HisF
MLSKRIIPQLLCRGRKLIKGKQFQSWRSVGVAAQAVRIFQKRGVDELMLLDIGATPEGRSPDLGLIKELSEVCFMPLTVGGGIKTLADARAVLRAGADKVAIGAGGFKAIREISDSLGNQAVIGIMDYKEWQCSMWIAEMMQSAGAGEIMLQCIDREGMMEGYDVKTIARVSKYVDIPLIAAGGCGTYDHMLAAIEAGADAVAAGSIFQFTDSTPRGAAQFLQQHNVEVRVPG